MIMFFFILKRLKGGSLSIGKYPVMKNLATLSLGPKRSLTLIEICDQWLLVGVGAENISLISKIDKPSDDSLFNKNFPKEGNIFESFLSRAGLANKASEGSKKK